jgi:hypothetical protein
VTSPDGREAPPEELDRKVGAGFSDDDQPGREIAFRWP